MEDGDTQLAVGVDVGMPERAVEREARWLIGVVLGEGHSGFVVAAIVEAVGVEDNECDRPLVDVVIDEINFGPCLLAQVLVLVHEHAIRHFGHLSPLSEGMVRSLDAEGEAEAVECACGDEGWKMGVGVGVGVGESAAKESC